MNTSFEQVEQLASQIDLNHKQLLINLLEGQVSEKSCLDVLAMHRDSARNCQSRAVKRKWQSQWSTTLFLQCL